MQQQRLGALGGEAAAQGANQRQELQLMPIGAAARYHVHPLPASASQKLVQSHHKSHTPQYTFNNNNNNNHHRQLHQHHLQTSNHYLHLQPSNQNLVHKPALAHHQHLSQQQQRLKQIASYAAQQVADASSYQHQTEPLESSTGLGSHYASIEPASGHQLPARVEQGDQFRPRVSSVSTSCWSSGPQARPAGCSSVPFITRSMSFSTPTSQERPSSADRSALGHHISGTQQHRPMTSATYGGTSATISPSDALTLGINLEQYISKRNERERSRVRNVNEAFDNLKNSLPLNIERQTKRMSKVEILRTAIGYIRNLEKILGDQQQHFTTTTTNSPGNSNLLLAGAMDQQSAMEQQHHQLTMMVVSSSSNTPTTSVSSITSTPAVTPAQSPAHSSGLVSPNTATSVVSEYFGHVQHGPASNFLGQDGGHFQQLKQQVVVGAQGERLYHPEPAQQQQQLVSVPQEGTQIYYQDLKRHIEYDDKYRGY